VTKRTWRLQDWERQAILDAYCAGEKTAAIGAEFGCAANYPAFLAKAAGIARRAVGRPKTSGPAKPVLIADLAD